MTMWGPGHWMEVAMSGLEMVQYLFVTSTWRLSAGYLSRDILNPSYWSVSNRKRFSVLGGHPGPESRPLVGVAVVLAVDVAC